MSGVLLVQTGGAGILNLAGAQNPAPFTSVITGLSCLYSFTGTPPASITWTLAVPAGSQKAKLSATTGVAGGNFRPDIPGEYGLVGTDNLGNSYTLQLIVQRVAITYHTGPNQTPTIPASNVQKPEIGEAIFCDAANGNRLSAKNSGGIVHVFGTDSSPRTLNVILDFGAKGDGTTDDSTAINTAIASAAQFGMELIFPYPPGGFYAAAAPIKIGTGTSAGTSASGVTLRFDRRNHQGGATASIKAISDFRGGLIEVSNAIKCRIQGGCFDSAGHCDYAVRTYQAPGSNNPTQLLELDGCTFLNALVHNFLSGGREIKPVADATANNFTLAGHGFANNTTCYAIAFDGGVLPGGLAVGTLYYVVNTATNTFQLSLSSGGAAIDLSTAGSGQWCISETNAGDASATYFKNCYTTGSTYGIQTISNFRHRSTNSVGVKHTGFFIVGGMLRAGQGPCTVDAGANTFTLTNHGLLAGDMIRLWSNNGSSPSMPGGLTVDTSYYVIASGLTSSVFKLATTPGGSAIDITTTGTNVFFAYIGFPLYNFAVQGGSVAVSGGCTASCLADFWVDGEAATQNSGLWVDSIESQSWQLADLNSQDRGGGTALRPFCFHEVYAGDIYGGASKAIEWKMSGHAVLSIAGCTLSRDVHLATGAPTVHIMGLRTPDTLANATGTKAQITGDLSNLQGAWEVYPNGQSQFKTCSLIGTTTCYGAVQIDPTQTAPTWSQPARSGTGANAGATWELDAQPGQAQTGVAANNAGGSVRWKLGAPGTGGSGAVGAEPKFFVHNGGSNDLVAVYDAAADVSNVRGLRTKVDFGALQVVQLSSGFISITSSGSTVSLNGQAGWTLYTNSAPSMTSDSATYFDIVTAAATAPAAPAIGFRIYIDSADSKLKAKSPGGVVTILANP